MAEEVKAPDAVDVTMATEETSPAAELVEEPSAVEATADDATAPGEGAEGAETSSPKKDAPSSDVVEAADKAGDDAAAAAATPASSKKVAAGKRKSGAGVPEHNRRKSLGKKKEAPEQHLDAQPGELYFVAMKGYPPWPVMVCDEEILPEVLLSKRPVSAKRLDGTYREDFADGGKHIKDRRFPIMFLGTNEFSWEANTNLRTLDIEQVKKEVAAGNTTKKKKALWEAYEIAAEEHDLQWFKDLLEGHDKAMQLDVETKAASDAKKAEKKKRKSTATVEPDDMDVDDVDEDGETGAKKANKNKKRKKSEESEGESEKPVKTPKTKLTLKNKTPKEASAAKPKAMTKAAKAKAAKSASEEESSESAKVEEKPMSEAERREKQEKSVLYLRHRLQKGFLARDAAPKEDEMETMSAYLTELENLTHLAAEVIRKTKVHKVLKAIMKLESIPKEDAYNFKQRSANILASWSGALAAEEPAAEVPAAPITSAAATNGTNGTNGVEKTEPAAEKDEKPAETTETTEGGDGDVAMTDAKDEAPTATAEASAEAEAEAETAAVTEGVAEITTAETATA